MRRIITLLISILAITTLSATAFASSSYDVDELKLSVNAPDDWLVVTLDPEQNAEVAEFYSISPDTLVDFLKERKIFINFVNNQSTSEIFITMTEDEYSQGIISINAMSEKQLNQAAKEMMKSDMDDVRDAAENLSLQVIDAENVEWHDYEIYYHDQAVFIKFYLTKTIQGSSFPAIQYLTIQNGQSINVFVQSYTDSISNDLELQGQAVVDSIVFAEIQEGYAPKNTYTRTKNIVLIVCIVSIVLAAIFYILSKRKQNNIPPEPPTHISHSTYSGNLE